MPLPSLGPAFVGSRLVHLTDLHSSPIMREEHLIHYMDLVNHLEPDFVVITGDFITASARPYVRRIGRVLKELSPQIATLACLGNHDYGLWHPTVGSGVRGLAQCMTEHLDKAGVIPLVSQSRTYHRDGHALQFAGLGDLWTDTFRPDRAFSSLEIEVPTIALVHNPDAAPELASMGADHVLCGHTHGKASSGSRLGNLLFPMTHQQFIAGQYDLPGGKSLYVNSGLGHASISRKSYRPEIAVFTLCQERVPVENDSWVDVSNSSRDDLAPTAQELVVS
jgi:predicted MPP superfamily phosphohydrolase